MRVVSAIAAFVIAISSIASAQGSPAQPVPDFGKLVHQFDYDAKAPLDVRENIIEHKDGFTIRDVSYASPQGGRVSAYMVVPDGNGPYAGILFGPWGPGNRTEFLPEAIRYAKAGAASLLIDYPWTRTPPWRINLSSGLDKPEFDRAVEILAVIDLRRGLDLLASRQNVDPKRLAYVGHSWGAQWGAILSAVDKRIQTAVLMCGVREAADMYLRNPDPDFAAIRNSTTPERLEHYLAVMSTLDAVRYVPHSRVPLLFQFARFERYFDAQSMDAYFEAARSPKKELWYDTGHELNDPQALCDRYDWLRKYVRLWPDATGCAK